MAISGWHVTGAFWVVPEDWAAFGGDSLLLHGYALEMLGEGWGFGDGFSLYLGTEYSVLIVH